MDLEIGRVLHAAYLSCGGFLLFRDREAKIEDEGHEAHEASWLLQKAIAIVEGLNGCWKRLLFHEGCGEQVCHTVTLHMLASHAKIDPASDKKVCVGPAPCQRVYLSMVTS